jgi:hypothetical protein
MLCESQSLFLSKKYRLRVFENRVLRGIFGRKVRQSNRRLVKIAQRGAS